MREGSVGLLFGDCKSIPELGRLGVLTTLAALLANVATLTWPALADDFQGISTLTSVVGISRDGMTVAGGGTDPSSGNPTTAFIWTSAGGAESLGFLNGGSYSQSRGISGNGQVVVGRANNGATGISNAFSWTNAGGMVSLGLLNNGAGSSAAAASTDGSVIVGEAADGNASNGLRAFIWTAATGMQSLGLINSGTSSQAFGVSGDGTIVVGQADDGAVSQTRAFRWTAASGMQSLGVLNGGTTSSANAISADGSTIVGNAVDGSVNKSRGFVWTSATGMQSIGSLNGGNTSFANAVSSTGLVVVGRATDGAAGNANRAIRWTQATGVQSIQSLLTAAGVNMTGWTLTNAAGVSADGTVITGAGVNTVPMAHNQFWIARLCDLPGTCGLGGSGLITLADQTNSFAGVGSVGQTASAALGSNFSTVIQQATQSGNATRNGSPFSVFSAMGYDSDPTFAGTLGGTAKLNDEGLIVGATVGADNIKTNTYDAGSSRMNAGTFALFTAQVPNVGLQWLMGVNAIYLDGRISRGYLNGSSPVTSTGHTHGEGYGLAGRVGYTFENVWSDTSITPFASYTLTRVNFSGYIEADGPFPAIVDSFHDIEHISRLGADTQYKFSRESWIWGTIAWGHRLDAGNSPDVSGTLIGLVPLAATGGVTTRRDWAEVTAGVRYGPWTNGAVTASLTVNLPDRGAVNYFAHLGVSQAF
jgi:probable HAF family extracellular repeat protein